MLEVVAQIPEGAANLMLNGIDSSIIYSTDYHRALSREIARVIRGGGIVLGCNSVALNPDWMHAEGLVFAEPLREEKESNRDYLAGNWQGGEELHLYIFESESGQVLSGLYQKHLEWRKKLWPGLEI
jgi:hypothetical protein